MRHPGDRPAAVLLRAHGEERHPGRDSPAGPAQPVPRGRVRAAPRADLTADQKVGGLSPVGRATSSSAWPAETRVRRSSPASAHAVTDAGWPRATARNTWRASAARRRSTGVATDMTIGMSLWTKRTYSMTIGLPLIHSPS